MSTEGVMELVDRSMEVRSKYPDLAQKIDDLRKRVKQCREEEDYDGEGKAKVEIGVLCAAADNIEDLDALLRGPCA